MSHRADAIAFVLILALPLSLDAQRAPLEFTKQSILVGNFWVTGTETPSQTKADLKFGREVGDGVRKRLSQLINKRETSIIDGYDMREALIRASFSPEASFS